MSSALRVDAKILPALMLAATSCAEPADVDLANRAGDVSTIPHPCNESSLMVDFWNCGACDISCDATDADSCVDGACRCGLGAACGSGQDCRFGRCVASDPTGETCEFDAECVASHACVEAHCSFVQCEDEECDGFDNDCDGEIDEAQGGMPLSEWCSSAPDVELLRQPCQRGVRVCTGGRWSACVGEVPPVAETGLLRCDGVDNDCDGCPDGAFELGQCTSRSPSHFDVAYLIDISASMQGTIDAVRTATSRFSQRLASRDGFRFGIVTIPSADTPDRPAVHTDLTEIELFETALATLESTDLTVEPQLDAIFELGTGTLPLSWHSDSVRILIVFTDEEAQTTPRDGLGEIGEAEMCGSLAHGEVLGVVTKPDFYPEYDQCAIVMEIGDDSEAMEEALDQLIADPCG